tara:strand:- start:1157 stop:1360 length:204 start_codon:yes stop_codon:yes gene_type:complete
MSDHGKGQHDTDSGDVRVRLKVWAVAFVVVGTAREIPWLDTYICATLSECFAMLIPHASSTTTYKTF